MEQDISNWQNLWKEGKSTSIDMNKLIQQLNSIEQKGKLERIILLISTPITIILLMTILPVFSNIHYLIAIILIGLGMLTILIQSYRSKYNLIDNGVELNNEMYIKTLIKKLKERMLTTSRYMWIYTFLLVLGLNIGYLDILEKFNHPLIAKIITHIVLTSVMFYIMYYGIEKRKKKHSNEILPLVEVLKNLDKK